MKTKISIKKHKKSKKGGKGNYTKEYLKNSKNIKEDEENGVKVEYVLDEDGNILEDFIGHVRLDRAILINGRIYDVQNIFDWVVKNKNTTDPNDREDISDEKKRIIKKFIKVFGEKEYQKEIDKMNAPPPSKPVAYDQYGNMVDKYPHPQYFVDANGETFFEYNVNRNGQPILANGELIYIPRPANRIVQPLPARRSLNQLIPIPPRRSSLQQRQSPPRRYTLHFDRPINGFLVDNHNNPSNFVTVEGDIIGPYLLDDNYFPIDVFGENILVVRRNQLDRNIIQNSIIHTATFSPRTRHQSNALAGISPPASPRAPRRNTNTPAVTGRRGRPARNTQPLRSTSPPAARISTSPPVARRSTSPSAARNSSPPAARNSSPPAARRRGRPRRQQNP
jgi:hypothetical protein